MRALMAEYNTARMNLSTLLVHATELIGTVSIEEILAALPEERDIRARFREGLYSIDDTEFIFSSSGQSRRLTPLVVLTAQRWVSAHPNGLCPSRFAPEAPGSFKPGDRVRMTSAHKVRMALNGSAGHVAEFGGCLGHVDGPVDFGTQQGPEIDVRWEPSRLRYAYDPADLERA